MGKKIVAAFIAGFLICSSAAAMEKPACGILKQRVENAPPGPVMLASFDGAPSGPLEGTAFLYDNAVALIALVGCGEIDKAERIADAFVLAQNADRHWKDGRLRNAYRSAAGETSLPPGWWDKGENAWLEDKYQVGSDNGNMAWAALALALLAEKQGVGPKPSYVQAAVRLGNWILTFADDRGLGGFSGGVFGHEPDPARIMWKSTEHNADLAAAFAALFRLTKDAKWEKASQRAEDFVLAMWDAENQRFMVGTTKDGITPNPFLALDAQIWPLMAIAATRKHASVLMEKTLPKLAVQGGYRYADVESGLWTEGTAQAALLMRLFGKKEIAQELLRTIEKQKAESGYYHASGPESIETGFKLDTDPTKPRLYFHLPHLGATAWVCLAQTGFNPFTGQ